MQGRSLFVAIGRRSAILTFRAFTTRVWCSGISWVQFPFGLPRFCLSISRLKIISLFILFRLAVLGQLMPFANDSLSRVIPFTMPGPPKPPVVHVTDVKDREVRITISYWVKISSQTARALIGGFEVTWYLTINLFRGSRVAVPRSRHPNQGFLFIMKSRTFFSANPDPGLTT